MLKRSLALIALILPIMAQAAAPKFVEGKDYALITDGKASQDKVIRVYEFFNYECPWCFRFEDKLEPWLKNKPKDVQFTRVPVSFNKIMRDYSKVFYVAKALKVEDKVTRPLFSAIHKDGKDLSNPKALAAFFAQYGVNAEAFDSAYRYSMSIDAQIKQAEEKTVQFQIYGVPAMVVDGVYRTDSRMNQGDGQRMLAVVDFLIAKIRAKNKQ